MHLRGVAASGLDVAPAGGQYPEVGEYLVAARLAALDLVCHFQAGCPDLIRLLPVPGGDQVQEHHPPALDGIDGRAGFAQLGEGRLQRAAAAAARPRLTQWCRCVSSVGSSCPEFGPTVLV